MLKRIYVGHLPSVIRKEDLKALFEPFGTVRSIQLADERDLKAIETERDKWYNGYSVALELNEGIILDEIMKALNNKLFNGKKIKVRELPPKRFM